MPNSLKSRLKKLEHQGLLNEKDMSRIMVIPDNATNGDMIKALLPEAEIRNGDAYRDRNVIYILVDNLCVCHFRKDWWNAPYKENKECIK